MVALVGFAGGVVLSWALDALRVGAGRLSLGFAVVGGALIAGAVAVSI